MPNDKVIINFFNANANQFITIKNLALDDDIPSALSELEAIDRNGSFKLEKNEQCVLFHFFDLQGVSNSGIIFCQDVSKISPKVKLVKIDEKLDFYFFTTL